MDGHRESDGLSAILMAAGIVGPLLFILVVAVQGWVRPGYSHLTMPVSALGAGPSGWIQNMNFMLLGLLLIAQSVGVHLGIRSGRPGALGPALLALSGLALVGAGVFPATDVIGDFSPGQPLHSAMSVLAFLAAGGGMAALSRQARQDPGWGAWSRSLLALGIGTLLMLVVFGALAQRPGAPLHDWMGLVQRALIGVWLAGIVLVSLGFLRHRKAESGISPR